MRIKKGLSSKLFILYVIISIFVSSSIQINIAAEDDIKNITILHTNDMHSRVKSDVNDGMGLARVSTLVKKYKEENSNTILVDAGDAFHGQPIGTIDKGESIVKIMNEVGYDAIVPGNHDFNYGYERLLQLSNMSKFSILGANIEHTDSTRLLSPYIIKEFSGVKIAIVGLCTPETAFKTNPSNVKDIIFKDPIKEAQQIVKKLKEKVDVFVFIGHLGMDSTSTFTSTRLVKEVPEVDVFIDGHSHTVLKNGLVVNNSLIASAGEYDKNLGVVKISLKDKKIVSKKASLVDKEYAEKSVQEDQNIIDLIIKIEEDQNKIVSEIVGKTNIRLDGEREIVRVKESNLADLVADAMKYETNADVVLYNGGGIRASIEKGNITKREVISVMPFGNYIITKKLTGSQIKLALEQGVAAYPEPSASILQVSGLRYSFDPSRSPNERVSYVSLNGVPLIMDKVYIVAINDFLGNGGDDFEVFKNGEIECEFSTIDESFSEYLKVIKEINTVHSGRITHKTINEGLNLYEFDRLNAEQQIKEKIAPEKEAKIYKDNKPIELYIKPQVKSDKVILPIGSIGKELGATLNWNDSSKSIDIKVKDKIIQLKVGSKDAKIDGQDISYDKAPEIVNNRAMVSLQCINNIFDVFLNWNDKLDGILIN